MTLQLYNSWKIFLKHIFFKYVYTDVKKTNTNYFEEPKM